MSVLADGAGPVSGIAVLAGAETARIMLGFYVVMHLISKYMMRRIPPSEGLNHRVSVISRFRTLERIHRETRAPCKAHSVRGKMPYRPRAFLKMPEGGSGQVRDTDFLLSLSRGPWV